MTGPRHLVQPKTEDVPFKAPRRPPKAIGLKTGVRGQVCSCVRLRAAQELRDISESFWNFVNFAFDRDDTTCRMKAHKRRSLVNYAKQISRGVVPSGKGPVS